MNQIRRLHIICTTGLTAIYLFIPHFKFHKISLNNGRKVHTFGSEGYGRLWIQIQEKNSGYKPVTIGIRPNRSCGQLSMSPAIACLFPTPVFFALKYPMCENIIPKKASGIEKIQQIKKKNGAIIVNTMAMIPRTNPAVAEVLFCATTNTIPC